MTPASPWIGSTRKAAVRGLIARANASASPYGMIRNPGVNGPNPERETSSVLKETTAKVRPWKLPPQTMISA